MTPLTVDGRRDGRTGDSDKRNRKVEDCVWGVFVTAITTIGNKGIPIKSPSVNETSPAIRIPKNPGGSEINTNPLNEISRADRRRGGRKTCYVENIPFKRNLHKM